MDSLPAVRFAIVYLSFLMQNDPGGFKEFVRTTNIDSLLPHYDFIIVGAGSAGSTLAGRLSENPNWQILLLEAGEQEDHFSRTPSVMDDLQGRRYDWNYSTTKQRRSCLAWGGICSYPRGKVLGGSSSINGMIYMRGYRSDYDRWGKVYEDWNFNSVFPYFLKAEGNQIPGLKNRGRQGPLTVTYSQYSTKIKNSLLQAGEELGWKKEDCQDYEDNCIQYSQHTVRDGRRCSASTAYLEPVSFKRENLHIVTSARVTKIMFKNDNVAFGVQFSKNGTVFIVKTKKEVILSAGSIDSPKLLMLSGVGPRHHLQTVGVEVIADLPVGNNLQDHPIVSLDYRAKNGSTKTVASKEKGVVEYLQTQTGPLCGVDMEVTAFSKLGHKGTPKVQYHMLPYSSDYTDRVSIQTMVSRPKSRGTVRLSSMNPIDDPLIDVNYYDSEHDFNMMIEGLKTAVALSYTNALKGYIVTQTQAPLCTEKRLTEYLRCVTKYYTTTVYHPVGTAKMSPKNKRGVVNNNLQVYGVRNLRVIDASIAPYIISMNINAMAIMIGEKGADIIKSDYSKL